METPDLHQRTLSPAADNDPVAVLLLQQTAEVAALRARLRDVEAALDLPARPGRPAPPTLPALRGRVAALERHLGLTPGLAPLPGGRSAATLAPAASSATARASWRDWGQTLAGAVLALALLAWLVYPAHPGTRTLPTTTVPPAAVATSAAAAVPAAPPPPATEELPVPLPAPVVDCPLTTAGNCFGQWSAPPSSPTNCATGMVQDVLAMLDTCFEEAPAPPSEP